MAVMRNQMGQTGDEAGRVLMRGSRMSQYVATSKSFNVNKYLQTDQKNFLHPQSPWKPRSFMCPLTENEVKNIINNCDNGMKPLARDLKVIRGEESAWSLNDWGIQASMNQLKTLSQNQLNSFVTGKERTSKSYLSTSWNESKNPMGNNRDVVIEYTVKKGVGAIITNNLRESEALVGRGYTQKLTGAYFAKINGIDKLVLRAEISPNKRTGYYDLK